MRWLELECVATEEVGSFSPLHPFYHLVPPVASPHVLGHSVDSWG